MTVAVPGVVVPAVNVTPVQLATPVVAVADKMQLALTVPTTVLDETKLTVPDGVVGVVEVSVTVAVQVEVPPRLMLLRLQATVVDVGCKVPTVPVPVPVLVR